ncbi:MAG: hypothetical protein ACXACU_12250 [Candidatus Hodarchaeales archaeon]|jgi:hypothetical protein
MNPDSTIKHRVINAGRILVVGTQAGGKTAVITKLAARTDRNLEYQEQYGGTIETEFLRVSFDEGQFFSLLLPIGGQEKWASLRSKFGSTAESIVVILDSCTIGFWQNSLQQAISLSSVLPYNKYPLSFIVTKKDLNETIRREAKAFGEAIVKGIFEARTTGLTYYSRGFKISERNFRVESIDIPFTQFEQICVNALQEKYFTGLVPGDARKGKMLLDGFTLVNCRIFSRALTLGLSNPTGDYMSILALLNDMRPTMLELDSNWEDLKRNYPDAGGEPTISDEITAEEIEKIILNKLLASDEEINSFIAKINEMAEMTGWRYTGYKHISIFEEEGLDEAAELIRYIMESIKENEPASKFTLFEPIEELF